MEAKVIETGEIVNVTPYPTWYKENGQGPDRREWDEDELEFIYSNKKVEGVDLEKEIKDYIQALPHARTGVPNGWRLSWHEDKVMEIAKHFYELGLKAQKGEKL